MPQETARNDISRCEISVKDVLVQSVKFLTLDSSATPTQENGWPCKLMVWKHRIWMVPFEFTCSDFCSEGRRPLLHTRKATQWVLLVLDMMVG